MVGFLNFGVGRDFDSAGMIIRGGPASCANRWTVLTRRLECARPVGADMRPLRSRRVTPLQYAVVLLSFVFLGVCGFRRPRRPRGELVGFLEPHPRLWCLVNAVLCGAISGPYGRYQARVEWLIPLAPCSSSCSGRSDRRWRAAAPPSRPPAGLAGASAQTSSHLSHLPVSKAACINESSVSRASTISATSAATPRPRDGDQARQLYRSAHHGQATDTDLAAIAALNIAVIVDLRRGEERQRTPSRRHDGFAAQLIENDGNEAASDPFVEFIKASDVSEEAFRGYMISYYHDAPFDDRHLDLFSRYFHALGQAEGPILIHCTAGKDRTGLLAALTHHVAGVHRDDIFDDYLLTNRWPRSSAVCLRRPDDCRALGRTPTDAAVRTSVSVDAAYLERPSR